MLWHWNTPETSLGSPASSKYFKVLNKAMALASPHTVFLEKPQHLSYGEAMSRVRMWLDTKKIEHSAFKLAPLGRVGFEIGFRTEHDAALFQDGFNWPPP